MFSLDLLSIFPCRDFFFPCIYGDCPRCHTVHVGSLPLYLYCVQYMVSEFLDSALYTRHKTLLNSMSFPNYYQIYSASELHEIAFTRIDSKLTVYVFLKCMATYPISISSCRELRVYSSEIIWIIYMEYEYITHITPHILGN